MFVMRVGLSFILTTDKIAGLPKMGAFGYWVGMCADWALRSALFLSRLLTGKWKKSSGLFKEPAAVTAEGEVQPEVQPFETVADGAEDFADNAAEEVQTDTENGENGVE